MLNKEKIYIILVTLFSVLVVIGNLTYQKFVTLDLFYQFELSVGAILYPLTFLITALIVEFYGKERAKFCVDIAIAMNITAVVIVSMMDFLPATNWSKIDNAIFHDIFGFCGIALACSIFACYISQRLDIKIYLFIRDITGGKYLWMRNNISTATALLLDTTIVITLMTFFGAIDYTNTSLLIWNSYSWKLSLTICSTPIFYLSVRLIRYLESH